MWGKALPRWPSLIAVVDRAEREVVVEFGVPLWRSALVLVVNTRKGGMRELTVLLLACLDSREDRACR